MEDLRIQLKLASAEADGLQILEAEASKILADPSEDHGVNLAHNLGDRFPALAVLITRAILASDRDFDMYTLLQQVGEHRLGLGLDPSDIAEDLYDEFYLGRGPEIADQGDDEELRSDLTRLSCQARELTARLDAESQALARKKSEAANLQRQLERATAPDADLPQTKGLRDKVDSLARLLRERQDERASLRRQLAELSEARAGGEAASPVDAERTPELEPGITEEPESGGRARVPEFSLAARDDLRKLPATTLSMAIARVSEIARASTTPGMALKRIKSVDGLWSARLGRDYRVLFTLPSGDDVMIVQRVCLRRDLELTIVALADASAG